MLALAFIVIGGSTTNIASLDAAGASNIVEVNAPQQVKAMNIVEEKEESNWFDKLCDSLSK